MHDLIMQNIFLSVNHAFVQMNDLQDFDPLPKSDRKLLTKEVLLLYSAIYRDF